MASGIYNRAKYNALAGRFDVSGSGAHSVACALLTSSHAFNADHNYWTTVSANEVSGAGYTPGGKNLENLSLTQDDTNDRAAFDADDVTWASSTITAAFAVLYDASIQAKDLVAAFDFGQDYASNNGNFTIQWHSSGILLLT